MATAYGNRNVRVAALPHPRGMSIEEVASALDLPRSTVIVTEQRALKKLRLLCEERGYRPEDLLPGFMGQAIDDRAYRGLEGASVGVAE